VEPDPPAEWRCDPVTPQVMWHDWGRECCYVVAAIAIVAVIVSVVWG